MRKEKNKKAEKSQSLGEQQQGEPESLLSFVLAEKVPKVPTQGH